jgi:hypothetical protein
LGKADRRLCAAAPNLNGMKERWPELRVGSYRLFGQCLWPISAFCRKRTVGNKPEVAPRLIPLYRAYPKLPMVERGVPFSLEAFWH